MKGLVQLLLETLASRHGCFRGGSVTDNHAKQDAIDCQACHEKPRTVSSQCGFDSSIKAICRPKLDTELPHPLQL